jgi:hypothetical protein
MLEVGHSYNLVDLATYTVSLGSNVMWKSKSTIMNMERAFRKNGGFFDGNKKGKWVRTLDNCYHMKKRIAREKEIGSDLYKTIGGKRVRIKRCEDCRGARPSFGMLDNATGRLVNNKRRWCAAWLQQEPRAS